jgi:heme exporter protein D
MRWIVAALVVAPVVLLAAGALTGRARVRCCTAADPRRDARMRAAFADGEPSRDPR